ncbi:TRAP transporter large permease subunit [Alsobacter soli]|nr:TRAP transporter large permease subunit [Alsobacter soli]
MVLLYLRSRSGAGETRSHSVRDGAKAAVVAIPALVAPVMLIGGIVSGAATPTQVSSTAVVYALVLSFVFYWSMGLRQLWSVMASTAAQAGMVLFITSTASTFWWSLTIAKLPQQIASLGAARLGHPVHDRHAGHADRDGRALLETLPALLIFGPLLLPMAIDPLQYGIVMIIAMGFGALAAGLPGPVVQPERSARAWPDLS